MYPKLVEQKIKNIVHTNLKYCHNIKLKYYNFLYNIFCFIFIIFVIGVILYMKYKNKQNHEFQKKRRTKNEITSCII